MKKTILHDTRLKKIAHTFYEHSGKSGTTKLPHFSFLGHNAFPEKKNMNEGIVGIKKSKTLNICCAQILPEEYSRMPERAL
jgi:hypothetical protein